MTWKSVLSRVLCELYSLLSVSRPRPGFRILMYHAVGTALDFDSNGLSIAPELFHRQMSLLQQASSLKITALGQGTESGPGTHIAVTFDDGYQDNLSVAAPILAELEIPFTIFIVPTHIESGHPYYLTLPQLRELASLPGCSVGSHGMRHVRLAPLSDSELLGELRDSRLWLEDVLGRSVRMIAYPYGSASRRVRNAAERAGYTLGVCSRTGINGPQRDPLLLCRTEILASDSARLFRHKLYGHWDWHRFLRKDPALI